MKIVRTLPFPANRDPDRIVGLVPTMGYLHEGHVSLMRRAREECGVVVLSIFVNPLQFGPNEDYAAYPRDPERDLRIAADAGVDIVFMPDVGTMYPRPTLTTVQVKQVTDRLCGASRPGHFDGVATVVTKLFNIVKPDRAYFGQKDAQQVAVIRQMVFDLNIDVQIIAVPTVREPDGLALSSRNVYLSPQERKEAPVLYQALNLGEQQLRAGHSFGETRRRMAEHIRTAPCAVIDYVELLTYPRLEPLPEDGRLADLPEEESVILALAVKIGKTRLIDNKIVPAEAH
jgi:pantoate--beta-alanine ligase